MKLESNKGRIALGILITKIWEDPELEKKFFANPTEVLQGDGIDTGDKKVVALQNTEDYSYVVLTEKYNFSNEDDKNNLVNYFKGILPIQDGKELRFVQNTANTYYIGIPIAPEEEHATNLKGVTALNLAASSGYEATYHDTTQTVEAETTEAVVAETTEATQAETTVAVVAEGPIVLI